ncbi:hypothetical protein DICSQDRAFT_139665 [Dichomitus squalens LYAD-421 SS1]|uniref:Protein kinase domain-containing protein n=1 Tax=Dichomitus squalens (strain LYAD-421) TaxID=732165 RepID=R7SQ28_DICSQ|nr:uncharacterized protein DICSQDRAFT_139665 [Dichomitus squalens LYAD-421 SS1]EJF58043.1 hypothetical protein DICSQDRAFT_139665 [Dichomitus squalens LYAD-421 SS1]
MPDVDYIFFYPHPDGAYDIVVTVAAAGTFRLSHLWKLAREQEPSVASHLGAAKCTFYVPSDLLIEPGTTLLSRSRQWLLQHRQDDDKVVRLIKEVRTIFPDGPSPDLVHFLVVTEEVLESLDELGTLQDKALRECEKRTESIRNDVPRPSAGVSDFAGVQNVIVKNADKFHAGRPAGNYGPPASLFNHALGRFDYHLRHLDDDIPEIDPPPALIRLVHSLMAAGARSYPDARVEAIKTSLSEIFAKELHWEPSKTLYGVAPDAISVDNPPFVVVEVKNEVGLKGDASLQAGLSYTHIATAPQFKALRRRSNYPAILCGIMGNLLEIGVAIYTDGTYYNLLLSERLHLGFHSAKNVLRLSRAFAATRSAMSHLTAFYKQLNAAPPPQGQAVLLAKTERERQSGIYLATMPRMSSNVGEDRMVSSSSRDAPADSVEVVVKFTERYHPDAHKLLAAGHLAPALHACVPVYGDLFMVVMDRVHGTIAWEPATRNELLPHRIYEDVRRAIALLHSHDLVFGDLRTPNIMVVPGGSGPDDGPQGMLIDFDWVGTHGRSRYPASLDEGLPDWGTSGIQRHGIMDKAHDNAMLDRFEKQCHPAGVPV